MKRRTFLELGAAAPLVPLLGCGGGGGPSDPTPGGSVPTGAELAELPRLANTSSTPRLFEATLTASQSQTQFVPGVNTQVWAYNNQVPGPLIDVNEGDTVRINFVNNLPQDSTIHWHGVPVPPSQDGLPQDPIPPGASRIYQFTLERGISGTFWYHPHPHENSAEQVFRGLAGMFIIRGGQDPLAGFEQKNLFISDLRLDGQNAIPPNSDQDRLQGREGNHLLINGREQPRITIRPGSIQRWRIVNATNARFVRLALANHTLTLVGTDGGLIRQPVPLGEILISPAERVELLVTANQAAGSTHLLVALPYDRQRINAPGASAQVTLATLAYSNDAPVAPPRVPTTLRSIARFGSPVARKQVIFQLSNGQFLVNGKLFDLNRVDLRSIAGALEEWEVTNLAGMDHPFHIHQGQFQIVSRTKAGVTRNESLLAWKDTFNITPGESVRFRMVFPRKGLSVFHCHILEHEAHGMMGVQQIV